MNDKDFSKIMKRNGQEDMLLKMAKGQGYVPQKCGLAGEIVMGLINSGKNPCIGCNSDRQICGGRPKQ